MSVQIRPDGSSHSADDADLARLYDAVLRALQGGYIDEVAVALGQAPDPAWPAPERHLRPGKSESRAGRQRGVRRCHHDARWIRPANRALGKCNTAAKPVSCPRAA